MVDPGPPINRRPAAAAPPVAPSAPVGVPPAGWPVHTGPIAADSVATGMRAVAAAPAVILLGCAGVVLLRLPSDLAQFAALDSLRAALEQVARLARAAVDDPNALAGGTPTIAAEDGSGTMCGAALVDLFVASPLLAGVLAAGARAARGRAGPADLLSGFRRWPAVLLATVILAVIGSGMPFVAPLVAAVAWSIALPPGPPDSALAGLVDRSTVEVCAGVAAVLLVLPVVWGTSRLWFAIGRAADPERAPLAGHACIAWSWRATRGCQWGLFVLAALLFGLACAVSVPLRIVALQSLPAAGAWPGAAAWALSGMVALPVVVAVSGAAYSTLADAHEPRGTRTKPDQP